MVPILSPTVAYSAIASVELCPMSCSILSVSAISHFSADSEFIMSHNAGPEITFGGTMLHTAIWCNVLLRHKTPCLSLLYGVTFC